MTSHTDLNGQVAVITGAGRGIGRAIAIAFAAAGVKVVCSARSVDELDATVANIVDAGGEALAVVCDVTKTEQIESLFTRTVECYGGVDIVMVNAGVSGPRQPVDENDSAAWREAVEVNLIGAMEQCRAAIPHLKRRGGGKLLMTGSGVPRNAMPGTSAYACSKAGLAALNRVLARELRDDNIAVNEFIPGPVRTRMTGVPEEQQIDDSSGAPILSVPGEWIKNPMDVTPLVLFIAGLPNDGPTGQCYSLTARDLGRI